MLKRKDISIFHVLLVMDRMLMKYSKKLLQELWLRWKTKGRPTVADYGDSDQCCHIYYNGYNLY